MAPKPQLFGEFSTLEDSEIILVPVPFDARASYRRGTHGGPQAMLNASTQIDLCDFHFGKTVECGIHLLDPPTDVETLNAEATGLCDAIRNQHNPLWATRVNQIGSMINSKIYETVSCSLDDGKVVGVVGGDHSCPFALIQAYSERFSALGVLHIDAHADLRQAYEGFEWSHASIMRNVIEKTSVAKLVQVGVRDYCEEERDFIRANNRISTFFDQELADRRFDGETFASQCEAIIHELPHDVYISLDIDGLTPALCPSTGTPVPGGLSFAQLSKLLHVLAKSGKNIVGFDLCEVAPGPTDWDATVGMRVLYKLCGCASMAKKSRQN